MAEKPADKSTGSSKEALDLNSLSGLDFGPSWADANAKQPAVKHFESRGDSRGKGRKPGGRGGDEGARGGSRDRRSGTRPAGGGGPAGGRGPGGGGGERRTEDSRGGERGERREPRRDFRRGEAAPQREFFKPTVKVDIYPQDEAFEALVKRLRSTVRTYQLFEIAQLLLQKPERFVVVVSNLSEGGEKPAPLYFSVPGHLPFPTEEAAINHVLANNLDLFFEETAIEIDPPKGNFVMVNRCGITGELLGPPNYHRYQEFLQRHYAARIHGMSFERFVAKVETVKDQEAIDAWLASMTKGARYTLKDRQEGEPEALESMEAVRHFLLQHRKDKIVGSAESVRFAGRDIERLPKGDLRRSVEAYVEHQQHFPLESANNIRGRLRRHKFAVYKKGSKGVSFVCAVKRKFRDGKTTFTDSIQELIEFIEKHPNIPASKLPKQYIGIDTEKQQPEKLEMTEAEVAAAAEARKASEATAAATADAEGPVTDAGGESEAAATTETVQPAEAVEPEAAAEVPAPAPDAAASTAATPKTELSAEEQKRLNQLMLDLRWLIVEGYVTEYGDGRLFAAPQMPEPKKETPKAPKPSKPEAVTAEAKTATPTEDAEDSNALETPDGSEATEATDAKEAQEAAEAKKSDAPSEKAEAPKTPEAPVEGEAPAGDAAEVAPESDEATPEADSEKA